MSKSPNRKLRKISNPKLIQSDLNTERQQITKVVPVVAQENTLDDPANIIDSPRENDGQLGTSTEQSVTEPVGRLSPTMDRSVDRNIETDIVESAREVKN